MTKSNHVLKAKDVHIGTNKEKILLVLHSSKTHSPSNLLQEIKITSNNLSDTGKSRNFCPFALIRQYMKVRGNYKSAKEQFFIFADGLEVSAAQARRTLKTLSKVKYRPNPFQFPFTKNQKIVRPIPMGLFGREDNENWQMEMECHLQIPQIT